MLNYIDESKVSIGFCELYIDSAVWHKDRKERGIL